MVTEDLFGKVPPQATDLEEAVLGAIMLEKDAIISVMDILKPDCFYKDTHRIIFETILKLSSNLIPIDILTITEELRKQEQLEIVGGPYYLTQLTGKVASAAHVEYHARIVAQKHIQRELIRVASEIQEKAFDSSQDVDELLDFSSTSLSAIQAQAIQRGSSTEYTLQQTMQEIEDDCRLTSNGRTPGISTGFTQLDELTGGFRPGTLTVLAARPGVGKTSLALHFAKVAALTGNWVNFYSFEMSKTDLLKKLIAGESGVCFSNIRDGRLEKTDWSRIEQAAGRLSVLPIIWNDQPGNILQIKASIRKSCKDGKCGLVVLDYLQLTPPVDKKLIREQQVAEISRTLKSISMTERVPVVCLAQLNREAEGEEPKPSHLRESGAVEQDADIILLPWRPGYSGATTQGVPIPEGDIKILVAKNRRGPRGTIKIYANQELTSFSESTI